MLVTLIGKKDDNELNKLRAYFKSVSSSIKEYYNSELDILNMEIKGINKEIDKEKLLQNPIIDNIIFDEPSYYLASRSYKNENTSIQINDEVKIGGEKVIIMAGPCAVESENQLNIIAEAVKKSGASVLRGGAFKMRTSPYSFQGLGNEGLRLLKQANKKYNIPTISEIVSIDQISEFMDKIDIIQVGARNMQNYELLKALGKIDKPILLKRGMGSTIEEWLMSAEYILSGGNQKVILCERGIRTFEKMTRYTLDLSSVALVKKLSHLPVIVDPSHASGNSKIVKDLSLAAIACGADGLLIEVHNNPKDAISDGMQAVDLNEFKDIVEASKLVAKAINRNA